MSSSPPLSKRVTLLEALQDKNLVFGFRKFLQSEYAGENLSFWMEVQSFCRLSPIDKSTLESQAFQITNKYVRSGAPQEFNLDCLTRETVCENVDQGKITVNLFDVAADEIFHLMEMDSYQKFLLSDAYRECTDGNRLRNMLGVFALTKTESMQAIQRYQRAHRKEKAVKSEKNKKASNRPASSKPSDSVATHTTSRSSKEFVESREKDSLGNDSMQSIEHAVGQWAGKDNLSGISKAEKVKVHPRSAGSSPSVKRKEEITRSRQVIEKESSAQRKGTNGAWKQAVSRTAPRPPPRRRRGQSAATSCFASAHSVSSLPKTLSGMHLGVTAGTKESEGLAKEARACEQPVVVDGNDTWGELPAEEIEVDDGKNLSRSYLASTFRGRWREQPVTVTVFDSKMLTANMIPILRRQLASIDAVRHPNLLLYMGASTVHPSRLLCVTENVRCSVRDLLSAKNKPSFRVRMLIAKQIAQALNWLHHHDMDGQRIVYQNLSLENVFVTEYGDFIEDQREEEAGARGGSMVRNQSGGLQVNGSRVRVKLGFLGGWQLYKMVLRERARTQTSHILRRDSPPAAITPNSSRASTNASQLVPSPKPAAAELSPAVVRAGSSLTVISEPMGSSDRVPTPQSRRKRSLSNAPPPGLSPVSKESLMTQLGRNLSSSSSDPTIKEAILRAKVSRGEKKPDKSVNLSSDTPSTKEEGTSSREEKELDPVDDDQLPFLVNLPGSHRWVPYALSPELLQRSGLSQSHQSPAAPIGPHSDVYSFGVVLWELTTTRKPRLDKVNSLASLVREVVDHGITLADPPGTPSSLRRLLQRCYSRVLEDRPQLAEILGPSGDNIDGVLVDGLVRDREARRIWKTKWLDKVRVPWPEFVSGFCTSLGVPERQSRLSNVRIRCLESLLIPTEPGVVVSGSDGMGGGGNMGCVEIEQYGRLWQWLGPVRASPDFLKVPYELVRQAWFHGEISSEEAEKRVLACKKGAYLLRFSSTNPGCYSITVHGRGRNARHYRVQHQWGGNYVLGKYVSDSLYDLVSRCARELGLIEPALGSRFNRVFSGEEIRESGYFNPDLPERSNEKSNSQHSTSSSRRTLFPFLRND